jgi:hypothetical protein
VRWFPFFLFVFSFPIFLFSTFPIWKSILFFHVRRTFFCLFSFWFFSILYEIKIKKFYQSQVLNLRPSTKQDI